MRRRLFSLAPILLALAGCKAGGGGDSSSDGPREPPDEMGPLEVSRDNPRYFATPAGDIVVLGGSHTWENLVDQGPAPPDPPEHFDYIAYLDFVTGFGHNFFRLWAWTNARGSPNWPNSAQMTFGPPKPWPRTGPGNALDGKPKWDLSRHDQDYFDRVRSRVELANQRGIYVAVMFFQGFSVQNFGRDGSDPWPGHPFHRDNNIQALDGDPNGNENGEETHTLSDAGDVPELREIQKAYVRKLIDTLNDLPNVLYEISNESQRSSEEWQQELIDFVQDYQAGKPNQHPVGMTSCFGQCESGLFASNADWISPEDDWRDPSEWPAVGAEGKVSIFDSDHYGRRNVDRELMWTSFLRGHNLAHMDSYDCQSQGGFDPCPMSSEQNLDEVRRAIGQVVALGARLDLAHMVPSGGLSSTGSALADTSSPQKDLVTFADEGANVTLDLSSGTGETWFVEWMNVDTGGIQRSNDVVGGASVQLATPFAGIDSILLVTQDASVLADQGAAAPASAIGPLPEERSTPARTESPAARLRAPATASAAEDAGALEPDVGSRAGEAEASEVRSVEGQGAVGLPTFSPMGRVLLVAVMLGVGRVAFARRRRS
jgi:hypothetical protein